MTDQSLILHASGLLSKWGFGDGDVLAQWWWDVYDEEPPKNDHDLLYALVTQYLLPALRKEGNDVQVYRIHTNHNPVRAEYLNGRHLQDLSIIDDDLLGATYVSLTKAEVETITKVIVLTESAPRKSLSQN